MNNVVSNSHATIFTAQKRMELGQRVVKHATLCRQWHQHSVVLCLPCKGEADMT